VAKLNPWRLFKLSKRDKSLNDYYGEKRIKTVRTNELGRTRKKGIDMCNNRVPVMTNE
jgi:hypothetical protein